jgi:hypothetical protein
MVVVVVVVVVVMVVVVVLLLLLLPVRCGAATASHMLISAGDREIRMT